MKKRYEDLNPDEMAAVRFMVALKLVDERFEKRPRLDDDTRLRVVAECRALLEKNDIETLVAVARETMLSLYEEQLDHLLTVQLGPMGFYDLCAVVKDSMEKMEVAQSVPQLVPA